MTGKLNTTVLQVTGAGNLTVSTGTSGQFSANTVDSTGTFTLDHLVLLGLPLNFSSVSQWSNKHSGQWLRDITIASVIIARLRLMHRTLEGPLTSPMHQLVETLLYQLDQKVTLAQV